MTIQEIYEETNFRSANFRVVLGGDEITAIEVSVDFPGIAQVPTCTIVVPKPAPAVATFMMPVRIYAGFQGLEELIFSGVVLSVNPTRSTRIIQCVHAAYFLEQPFQEVVVEVDGSKTPAQLAQDVFTQAGLSDVQINVTGDFVPGVNKKQAISYSTWAEALTRIGEVCFPTARWFALPSGQVRFQNIENIPSGTAKWQFFAGQLQGISESQPAGVSNSAARPRIIEINGQERTRDVKNYIIVQGATIDEAQPDGTTISVDIEGKPAAPMSSPWIRKADGSPGVNTGILQNELFDDAVYAGLKAAEETLRQNRLIMEVSASIPGNPLVQLGTTVEIIDPDYTGLTGRWVIDGYTHRISADSFRTDLRLLGGQQAGGTINVAPFAQFRRTLEREIIGDREYIVGTFVASPSIDPDGEIVSYEWSDNQTPQIVTGTEPEVTVRVDASALDEPWEVTLRVVDDQGGEDLFTATVDTSLKGEHNFVAEIFAALDVAASGTRDAGVTWNDEPLTGVISVSPRPGDGTKRGHAVYGTQAGAIYLTTDYAKTVTQVLAPVGSPIVDLRWMRGSAVYAITENGRVYQSTDDGETFSLLEDLAASLGLPSIRMSRIRIVDGEVWACGGDGQGNPLLVRSLGSSVRISVGGDLADDALAAADPTLYIRDFANSGYKKIALILNSANLNTAVYYSNDYTRPSLWRRASGQPAKSRGAWITRDREQGRFALAYEDNACYTAVVSGGVLTVTLSTATLNAGDKHNQALWMGEVIDGLSGVFVVAAEGTADGTLYKTWNRFNSVAKLRPATGFPAMPSGANAKMVGAVGRAENPLGGAAPGSGREGDTPAGTIFSRVLVAQMEDTEFRATWRLEPAGIGGLSQPWRNPAVTVGANPAVKAPRCFAATESVWFIWDWSKIGGDADSSGVVFRTADQGQTWQQISLQHVNDMAMDPLGGLWALTLYKPASPPRRTGTRVYYSSDLGVSWNLDREFTPTSDPNVYAASRIGFTIAAGADVNGQPVVGVFGEAWERDVSDGGRRTLNVWPSFLRRRIGGVWQPEVFNNDGVGLPPWQNGSVAATRLWILPSGRWLLALPWSPSAFGSQTYAIVRSEDQGAHWTMAYSSPEGLLPAGADATRVVCMGSKPVVSTNGGISFSTLEFNHPQGGVSAATYHPFSSTLVTYNRISQRLYQLPLASTIPELQGWSEITENYPSHNDWDQPQNICFIPRT